MLRYTSGIFSSKTMETLAAQKHGYVGWKLANDQLIRMVFIQPKGKPNGLWLEADRYEQSVLQQKLQNRTYYASHSLELQEKIRSKGKRSLISHVAWHDLEL